MRTRAHASIVVEREEQEVEVLVSGVLCPAEPDVGIRDPYWDDIEATLDGARFELTEEEAEDAALALGDTSYFGWDANTED